MKIVVHAIPNVAVKSILVIGFLARTILLRDQQIYETQREQLCAFSKV